MRRFERGGIVPPFPTGHPSPQGTTWHETCLSCFSNLKSYPVDAPCRCARACVRFVSYDRDRVLFLASAVRLPQLLAQSALTAAEVTQVQKLLGDFLRFMQKNHATFFVQEYEQEEPVGLKMQNVGICVRPTQRKYESRGPMLVAPGLQRLARSHVHPRYTTGCDTPCLRLVRSVIPQEEPRTA